MRVAYGVPYTYSQLLSYIADMEVGCLTTTTSGLSVPMLVLGQPAAQKKVKSIVITGRVHPGESNSSYVLEGLVDFIRSGEADYLRKR